MVKCYIALLYNCIMYFDIQFLIVGVQNNSSCGVLLQRFMIKFCSMFIYKKLIGTTNNIR